MNKIKALGYAVGGLVATVLLPISAFAQVTPPVMDSGIQTGVLAIVEGLKDTIFTNILAVLPLAGLVLVTIYGIGVLIGFFHRIARR